jgi:C-terminal processing protease CtpA/Prc
VLDLFQEFRDLSHSGIVRDSSGISSPFARLRFPDGHHNIAVLTVNSFMYPAGDFYSVSFRLLDSLKTQHLIIDLRDNMGGLLLHATELFSYLNDSSFRFIDRPIVNSRFRIFYPPGTPFSQHVLTTVLFPVAFYVYSPIKRLSEGGFSHNAMEARVRWTSPYRFRGSISLLVNSGTYSAASLLAANLKYAGNKLVVGEETGGATEGTVAMRLSTHVLPASRFRLRFGLGYIQPFYGGGEPGYGVMPDVLVTPSLDDRIRGEDPQLQTLLDLLQRNREE